MTSKKEQGKEEIKKHIVSKEITIREALIQLDYLASDAILFVVDAERQLLGSLTDGDLRRGFIKGLGFEDNILDFIQPKPAYVLDNEKAVDKLEAFNRQQFKVIPVLNEQKQIVDIINFRLKTTILPIDVVIMAGGKGKRLRPLTENIPKPLLKVGDKPIIEHNIDRLKQVGVKNIILSVNYLADKLKDYFGDGKKKGLQISYVHEEKPLGTIGSVLLVKEFQHEDIIVMNSDLLTNINFKDFYTAYKDNGADIAVAATSYQVDIPYAVLETDQDQNVHSLKEKPKYTYYSNAGIYLLKKELLEMIPQDEFYDTTDLMERVLEMDLKMITFPINGYWLDIGAHEDYKKAQEDIKHLKL